MHGVHCLSASGHLRYGLGCRFESYEEDSEGVTVKFEGGEPGPVRAKVLIGADGYFSAVRQQCLDDGPPDFAVGIPLALCGAY